MNELEEYKNDILKAINNMSKETNSELVKAVLWNIKQIVIDLYHNKERQ